MTLTPLTASRPQAAAISTLQTSSSKSLSPQVDDLVSRTDCFDDPASRRPNFFRRVATGWSAYVAETAEHPPSTGEYCMLSLGTIGAAVGGAGAFVSGIVLGALECTPHDQPIKIANHRGAEIELGAILIAGSLLHLTTAVGAVVGCLVGGYVGAAVGYPLQAMIACCRLCRKRSEADVPAPSV